MKKLLFIIFLSLSFITYSQSPKEISYQGVARNAAGLPLANQAIGIELKLHQGTAGGPVSFTEAHTKTTNSFGLFNLNIGSVNTTAFTAINWANGPYFLVVSIDPTGGTSYTSTGAQQLVSVPYALYAATSGNASSTSTITGSGIAVVNPTTGSLFNVNVPAPSLLYNTATNELSITQGTAVSTQTLNGTGASTISLTGTGLATVNPVTGSTFTVNVPNPTYSAANGNLVMGTTTLNIVPPLTLVNSVLSSGPATNSVLISQGIAGTGTISVLPIWSGTATLGNSGINQNIGGGIIMADPATPNAAPRLRVRSDDFAILAEDMSATHTFAVRSNIGPVNDDGIYVGTLTSDLHFMTANTISPNTMVLKKASNRLGIGTKTPSNKLHVNGNAQLDSSLILSALASAPTLSSFGQGKLYFTGTQFLISISGNPYIPLYMPNPWTQGLGTVTLSTTGDKVGMGTNAPTSLLDVRNAVSSSLTNFPVVNINNANPSFNSSAVLQVSKTTGLGSLIAANNSANSGDGISVNLSDAANTNNAVSINHAGTGAGLSILQTGSGIGINANVGSNSAVIANNNSNSFPAILAQNSGTHDALRALAGQGRALYAQSNANGLSTIETTNNGTGYSFLANKGLGVTGGVASFGSAEPSNGADVVLINNEGAGAALRTVSGTTSKLAIWMQNGHLKASGSQCVVTPMASSFTTTGNISFTGIYNDVKGTVHVQFSIAVTILNQDNMDIKVQFAKSYPVGSPPTVMITPVFLNFNCYLVSVTATDFTVRFVNNSSTAFSGITNFDFNYFVIE